MILSQWHNHNHYFKVCNHCCFIIIICQKFLTNFTIYHHAMLLSKHNIANWHGLEYCFRQILSGCVWKLGSTLWVEQGKNCEDIFVFSRCLDLDGRNKQSKDFSATMKLGISNVWKQMKLQRLCIRLNTDKEVSVWMLQIVGTYTKNINKTWKTTETEIYAFLVSWPGGAQEPWLVLSCCRYLVCKVDACNSIPTISMFDNGNILIIYTLVWHAK